MHSKRHRRERQRRAANKFRIRNGRRKQPTYRIGYRSPRRTWHWYVDLLIAIDRYNAKEKRQAQKITLTK